jgi:hypothetical protein
VPFRTCLPLRIAYCSESEEDEYERDASMNVLWILLGIGIFGVLAKPIARLHQHGGPLDLGCVSHQWLAEHRLLEMSSPQR